jgi:hypothetical protein
MSLFVLSRTFPSFVKHLSRIIKDRAPGFPSQTIPDTDREEAFKRPAGGRSNIIQLVEYAYSTCLLLMACSGKGLDSRD